MAKNKKYSQKPDPVHIEDPEAETYRVKLPGAMSPDALPDPPRRGEYVIYEVRARVRKFEIEQVNGSDRLVAVLDKPDYVYEKGKVPIVDEKKQGDPELPYESGADGNHSTEYGTGNPVDDVEPEDDSGEDDAATSNEGLQVVPDPEPDAEPEPEPEPPAPAHDYKVFSGDGGDTA